MAQVLVRDLNTESYNRLKMRAVRNQRSLQAELKGILQAAATASPLEEVLEEVQTVRRMFAERTFDDSTELLRADRER